jgi:hypothetical protein
MQRSAARGVTAVLAATSIVWHFRMLSLRAGDPAPRFPYVTTAAALTSCMLAVYVWFGRSRE